MRELEVLRNGHLKLDLAECKGLLQQDLAEMARAQLKRLIEQALLAERDRHMDLGYYEHAPLARRDFRNGFYFRDLVAKLGLLCRLQIPRTRKGFRSQLIPRYQRREQAVNNLILQAFLRGVSTRQVGQVLEPVLGEAYSAQTISNIARQLQQAVDQFHRRPLRDDYVYLFLDGIVLKVRDLCGPVRRRVVLVAYGMRPHGQREIIDYRFAHGESETAWLEFLQGLFLRGLQGKSAADRHRRRHRSARGAAASVSLRSCAVVLGTQNAQHRRQSAPQRSFLRGRSQRHLPRRQQRASARGFPPCLRDLRTLRLS